MDIKELIKLAENWEPSNEYMAAYQERLLELQKAYDKIEEDYHLY